jgi:hypothetical protein
MQSNAIVKGVDLEIEGLLPCWLLAILDIFRTIFSIFDLDFYLGVRFASHGLSLSDKSTFMNSYLEGT